jgi:hypothetical protein
VVLHVFQLCIYKVIFTDKNGRQFVEPTNQNIDFIPAKYHLLSLISCMNFGEVYWTQKLAGKLDFAGTSMLCFFECSALPVTGGGKTFSHPPPPCASYDTISLNSTCKQSSWSMTATYSLLCYTCLDLSPFPFPSPSKHQYYSSWFLHVFLFLFS